MQKKHGALQERKLPPLFFPSLKTLRQVFCVSGRVPPAPCNSFPKILCEKAAINSAYLLMNCIVVGIINCCIGLDFTLVEDNNPKKLDEGRLDER